MNKKELEEKRRQKNKDLVERMKKGESLALYRGEDTHFQPRGLIKKDKKELSRIFGEEQ